MATDASAVSLGAAASRYSRRWLAAGVIVLTKCDLADPAWLALVRSPGLVPDGGITHQQPIVHP